MSVLDGLSRDERQQLDARVFIHWKCPIDRNHEVLTEENCYACACIAVLALLDMQDDTGNDLTREARRVLDDFFASL